MHVCIPFPGTWCVVVAALALSGHQVPERSTHNAHQLVGEPRERVSPLSDAHLEDVLVVLCHEGGEGFGAPSLLIGASSFR